jgi:predicted kinase/GNAT superfamily N-acetyltransferase
MIIRSLEPSDVALIASIDRSEHVEVQYRIADGHLVEAPVVMADIPTWDPVGSGEHSVASQIAFCASVVADGATLLGAFDDSGELMGLATVHPTFEPGLAWLATLHVSRAHRRRGAASALWDAGVALAREAGATSLYVSAAPTGNAVRFYLGHGCHLADPVHPDLFAHEPEDIHLVFPLDGGDVKDEPGRLVVVTGLPGSGKTTLALGLAASMPAARMCPDDWMVASRIDLWDADARAHIEQLQLELALGLLRRGQNVVIEWGVWTREERDALREAARAVGAWVELRYVTAPVEELWRRIVERDREGKWGSRSITRAELEEWSRVYEPPSEAELATYDPPA